jgi:hypothetical protein
LIFRSANGLYECEPFQIDAIGKIIPFVIALDYKVTRVGALPSASLEKTDERCSTLILLWIPAMPKKKCQIQKPCEATASKMTVAPSECPLNWPCEAKG